MTVWRTVQASRWPPSWLHFPLIQLCYQLTNICLPSQTVGLTISVIHEQAKHSLWMPEANIYLPPNSKVGWGGKGWSWVAPWQQSLPADGRWSKLGDHLAANLGEGRWSLLGGHLTAKLHWIIYRWNNNIFWLTTEANFESHYPDRPCRSTINVGQNPISQLALHRHFHPSLTFRPRLETYQYKRVL